MISRREFLQVAAATAAMAGTGAGLTRAVAEQRLTEKELLAFEPLGKVTLVHVTDMHGAADAAVFPRALDQSRRRRREGPAAARHRQGVSRALRHRARLAGPMR